MENPFWQGLSVIADMMLLNLLTLLCCVPVITAGAALAAMNDMVIRIVRQEENGILKGYGRAFRQNLKNGILFGLILLAAYQTKPLDSAMKVLAIYGSNDTVLDKEKVKTGQTLSPAHQQTIVIDGGNHAQFGNYGIQKGDGQATISPNEQQQKTCDAIENFIQ